MSARRLSDLRYPTVVRHPWVFVAFVVFWCLMVVLGIGNIIRHIRDHVPFEFSFWIGWIPLLALAFILVRTYRYRRAAPAQARTRY